MCYCFFEMVDSNDCAFERSSAVNQLYSSVLPCFNNSVTVYDILRDHITNDKQPFNTASHELFGSVFALRKVISLVK